MTLPANPVDMPRPAVDAILALLDDADGDRRDVLDLVENRLLRLEHRHGMVFPTHVDIAPGVVVRRLDLPAGVLLAGAVHRHPHFCTMGGDITVWDQEGCRRLTGMQTFRSPAGIKRVGLTHAPTTWVTYHRIPDDMSDNAEIEEYLLEDCSKLQSRRHAR